MHFTRISRACWAKALIASLLFLQLATAAYACAMQSTPNADSAMAGMPCAQMMAQGVMTEMDPDQPGLCHQHCKGDAQSIEPAGTAVPAAPAMVVLFLIATPVSPASEARSWQARQIERDGTPPPPHAILHCCLRI